MEIRVPCECGRELTADSGQAGLTVTCECGRAVEVPAWTRPRETSRRRESNGPGLTPFGWVFLILSVAAIVFTGAVLVDATDALGLQARGERKLFRMIFIGGVWLVLAAIAAVLRVVFGVRFYRE